MHDIYYRQEQAVAMALRQEKKLKRESIYDSTSNKNDFDLAEVDHSLGMQGLKKINEQYYSVKNLNKSQERSTPKMSKVDMLFDNVKKSNQHNGFFFYKESKKLQENLQSGQLPPSRGGSSAKKYLSSKQASVTSFSKNTFSNLPQQQEQQHELSNSGSQQNLVQFALEKEINEAILKFSDNNQMTFAQLGGFLNQINVLQHIKYDESSKLSNEEEIIKSQQLNNSFSTEMRLHELFWEIMSSKSNESECNQRISSELVFNVTHFLLNKEKRESSPLNLKDNILIFLQSSKNPSNNHYEDTKCQELPETIIDDFILAWEQVVSSSRSDQIVKELTQGKKVRKRKVSFTKGSNSKLPPSNSKITKNESRENNSNNSGSNQNILPNENNYIENSFNSADAKGPRVRVRSSSSSSSSLHKNNIQGSSKKDQEVIEQDISNIINRIKRYSDQIPVNVANSNNTINNMTAMTVFEVPQRRLTTQSDQREKLCQSDQTYTYQSNKFNNNNTVNDETGTIQSLPVYLSRNQHSQSSQNINSNYQDKNNVIAQPKTSFNNLHQQAQGVIQTIKITEVSRDQYDQLKQIVPEYHFEKEVTFGESKQNSRYLSPQDILKRRNVSKIKYEVNNMVTPKKKSNKKISQPESEGRSLSPTKTKEEMRVINLMKEHELWKQDIIRKWILDKEDRDYEKQKEECTFQPNLELSKKFNENLKKNMKNNCDVISRLYDYSTPKKREMIQYQNLIEKECVQLGECTFKPTTNSNTKQYQHVTSKLSHSPISPSPSNQVSAKKYGQGSISHTVSDNGNQNVKGFEQAVERMKRGFEKTQDVKARRDKIRTGTLYETNKNKQFNPPSMLQRDQPKHIPFYYATITLNNGKQGKIALSEDDDPIQVAQNFSKTFQLNKDMTDKLKTNLVEQYKQHMILLMGGQL